MLYNYIWTVHSACEKIRHSLVVFCFGIRNWFHIATLLVLVLVVVVVVLVGATSSKKILRLPVLHFRLDQDCYSSKYASIDESHFQDGGCDVILSRWKVLPSAGCTWSVCPVLCSAAYASSSWSQVHSYLFICYCSYRCIAVGRHCCLTWDCCSFRDSFVLRWCIIDVFCLKVTLCHCACFSWRLSESKNLWRYTSVSPISCLTLGLFSFRYITHYIARVTVM